MAIELSGSEVEALIKIADADVKERKRGPRTLWLFPYDHHYTLEEQLESIRKLGTSGNPRAYEYLKKLPISKFIPFASAHWDGDTFDDADYGGEVIYPNAKGRLSEALHSSTATKRVVQEALLLFLRRLEEKGDYEEAAKVYPYIGMKERSDELFLRLIDNLESKSLLEEALRVTNVAFNLEAQLYFDSGCNMAVIRGSHFHKRRDAICLKLSEVAESEGRFLDAAMYLKKENIHPERRKELLRKQCAIFESQGKYIEALNLGIYDINKSREMELKAIDTYEEQGLFDKIAGIYSGFSDVDIKVVDVLEKHGLHKEAAVAAARSLTYVKEDRFRDRTVNLHLKVIEELEREGHLEEAAQFAEHQAFNYSLKELYTNAADIYQKLGLSEKSKQLRMYVR